MGHSEQRSSPNLVGGWDGNWSDNDGNQYTFLMIVREESNKQLSGTIRWTLTSTISDDLIRKVGRRGTETVEVSQRGEEREVRLRTVRLNDPDKILGPAEYNLTLSEDGKRLTGKTKALANSDTSEGRFFARRGSHFSIGPSF